MPSLNWIGKDKVLNHHNEVPYRILERKYSYGDDQNGNMVMAQIRGIYINADDIKRTFIYRQQRE